MKISALTAAIAAVTIVTLTGCGGGAQFGKELTITEPTSIAAITAKPAEFNGKRVLVEGGAEALRFKVEDGVITFPMSVRGKVARAEGIVSVKELSADEQIAEGEHHADETGTTFDPSTVSGPKVRIQLNGEGAIVD